MPGGEKINGCRRIMLYQSVCQNTAGPEGGTFFP